MTVKDDAISARVIASQAVFRGRIWQVQADELQLDASEPQTIVREYVAHPGAVAVMALDEQDRFLLLQQYRHPVRAKLWEPPAGLLDNPVESWQEAAARELYEEADLRASTWHTLVDYYTSPGGSSETIRIFLARGLTEVAEGDRYARSDEERDMPRRWLSISEGVEAVLAGDVHNPSAVIGILALASVRKRDWQGLRAPDAAWQAQ